MMNKNQSQQRNVARNGYQKKDGAPIPNESFWKDGAVIGDKDDTEDKEKL